MPKILIVYSTTDGHTLKICHFLQQVIEQQEHQVVLVSINDAAHVDLMLFDKIVIGASIRYGKHSPHIYQFIKMNQPILENKANAFFSVNLVARKPSKNKPVANPYLKKFLKQITWHPKEVAVFAGKIDYQKYSNIERQIIRAIMWITNGPTDLKTIVEFTDWEQVKAFGELINRMQ
jgi:menaquinone-dependent protoporphyrinogen oxidase